MRFPNGVQAWMLTRYDDVLTVLADPRLSRNPATASPTCACHPPQAKHPRNIPNADPPDYGRLRRIVAGDFTARRVAAHGWAELVSGYTNVLPMTVMCDILGAPLADQARSEAWIKRMITILANEAQKHDARGARGEERLPARPSHPQTSLSRRRPLQPTRRRPRARPARRHRTQTQRARPRQRRRHRAAVGQQRRRCRRSNLCHRMAHDHQKTGLRPSLTRHAVAGLGRRVPVGRGLDRGRRAGSCRGWSCRRSATRSQ